MGVHGSADIGPYAPQQPPPPPAPRSAWGRFWLGVLVGGCGLLLLEALGTCAAAMVAGSAAMRAFPPPGSFAGASQYCAPKPCLTSAGLALHVGPVNRNAGVGSPDGTPDPAFHRVVVQVTLVAPGGDREVRPGQISLRDSAGQLRVPTFGKGCDDIGAGALVAGKPSSWHLCYDVRGAPADPLTLVWFVNGAPEPLETRI